MKVMIANGKKIEKVGKCHKVKLQIQDFSLESPFFIVPLGGVDVVLGIQWLRTLGTYVANHQVQFIKFKWGGQKYKLHEFQAPENQVTSSSQMMKLSRKGAPAYVVQCHQLEMLSANMTREVSPEIQDLIWKHEKVFQDLPIKMPPNREIEHTIEVKAGSDPINVKPYRYPHLRKIEIERLIQDLLKCGTLIILEYLLKWKDFPKKTFLRRMKHFVNNIHCYVCFEDKAFFWEEGNVM